MTSLPCAATLLSVIGLSPFSDRFADVTMVGLCCISGFIESQKALHGFILRNRRPRPKSMIGSTFVEHGGNGGYASAGASLSCAAGAARGALGSGLR